MARKLPLSTRPAADLGMSVDEALTRIKEPSRSLNSPNMLCPIKMNEDRPLVILTVSSGYWTYNDMTQGPGLYFMLPEPDLSSGIC